MLRYTDLRSRPTIQIFIVIQWRADLQGYAMLRWLLCFIKSPARAGLYLATNEHVFLTTPTAQKNERERYVQIAIEIYVVVPSINRAVNRVSQTVLSYKVRIRRTYHDLDHINPTLSI